MLALLVCPFVLLVSESSASVNMYQPLSPILPSRATCEICNEVVDCITLDESQCQYYQEMEKFREEEQGGKVDKDLKSRVDNMLSEYVQEVMTDNNNYDCIPYISEYTDCNRENLCTGCNQCTCDVAGIWNCTVIQQCKANLLNIGHSVLMSVIENLKLNEIGSERSKRETRSSNELTNQLSYNDNVYNWWYGANVSVGQDQVIPNGENVTIKPEHAIHAFKHKDELDFDDVLNNIEIDHIGIYGKPYDEILPVNLSYGFDVPSGDNNNIITFQNLWDLLNYNSNQREENKTKTAMGLVTPKIKNDVTDFNLEIFEDVESKSNIMKRSQPNLTEINHTYNHTQLHKDVLLVKNQIHVKSENDSFNNDNTIEDLKENVFNPLSDMIREKQIEVQQLITIRNSLTKFMNKYSGGNYSIDIVPNITAVENTTVFSIHEIETINEVNDFRRTEINIIEKLNAKLKHDIFEILRDIASIHKRSKNGIPQHMKFLVRAIKYYVHSFNQIALNKKTRRFFSENHVTTVNKFMIKILEVIDTGKPETNALSPLSNGTKKVIRRVILNNKIDLGLSINSNYIMKHELENIGIDWQNLANKVIVSDPADLLYRLKLLHLSLSSDTEKISKALSIFDFTKTRRMLPIGEEDGEQIMASINDDLSNVNKKIQLFLMKRNKINMEISTKPSNVEESKKYLPKKKSFMKQLKNFLKNSKTDILRLFKNKVPKVDIIKQIAKAKLNNITNMRMIQYENTMRDWQRFFNVSVKRNKRSTRDRIKHILPKYLIGKVRPAINKNSVRNRSKEHKNVAVTF